jgi:hypothetical protein
MSRFYLGLFRQPFHLTVLKNRLVTFQHRYFPPEAAELIVNLLNSASVSNTAANSQRPKLPKFLTPGTQ